MQNVYYHLTLLQLDQCLDQIVDTFRDACKESSLNTSSEAIIAHHRLEGIERLLSLDSHFHAMVQEVHWQIDVIANSYQPDIESLGLTVRSERALVQNGIYSIKDLCEKTEIDLLRIPTLGKRSLTEIKTMLGLIGLTLSAVAARPPVHSAAERGQGGISSSIEYFDDVEVVRHVTCFTVPTALDAVLGGAK